MIKKEKWETRKLEMYNMGLSQQHKIIMKVFPEVFEYQQKMTKYGEYAKRWLCGSSFAKEKLG